MIHQTAVIKLDGPDSGVVENIIITDDNVPYEQLDGYVYVDSAAANIGYRYENGEIIAPVIER